MNLKEPRIRRLVAVVLLVVAFILTFAATYPIEASGSSESLVFTPLGLLAIASIAIAATLLRKPKARGEGGPRP